tara:strand:+ start:805 stop:1626 length:822 start_codon:yes stop_codon:yes gene_type:complete
MKSIFYLVMIFLLISCSTGNKVEPPLEVSTKKNEIRFLPTSEQLPSLKEFLTMGYLSEHRDEINKEREAHYKKKYVGDENDERNWIEKIVGKATLGLINGRETKKQYAARKKQEAAYAALFVPDELDERGFVDKSLNTLTLGVLADKETLLERENRLKREAEEAQKRDKRGVLLKSVEVITLGTFTPGKPEPIYPDGAVLKDPKLGQLVYGKSTLEDAIKLLGAPLKKVTQVSGEKEVVFKVEEGEFASIPYLQKPQINVRLSFNSNNVLVEN